MPLLSIYPRFMVGEGLANLYAADLKTSAWALMLASEGLE
jgi:hypothetical protein